MVASAYLPYDSKDPPPTEVLKALVRYCTSKGLELLVGCDANSHHTVWGSSNTNRRGVTLLEYLTLERLEELAKGLRGPCCKLGTIGIVKGAVGTLQTAINQAYEAACPTRQRKCSKKVTWWNKELGQLRTRSRKLLNRALKTGTVGYADDIALVVTGDHPQRMTNRMQKALDLVEDWCTSQSLRINPGKTEMVLFTRKRRFDLGPIRICGAELTRSTEAHVLRQAQEATATFWACRRMIGQTWGLRPRTLKWIYTAILLPQITFAAVIWWPATGRVNNRKALERVYRLATLGITGAMRITPTLAMGALLNLTPPHIAVETEIWRTALRLRFSGLWRGSGRGHTSILRLMEELIKQDISWKKDKLALLRTKGLVWFTDGSKKRGGAVIEIWSGGPRLSMSLALGNTATVFQAEVFAILSCVRKILTLGYRGKHIFICSDSRAALRLIDACVVRSKLVQECPALLRQLAQSNRVKLLWVPARKSIKGNIEADRLAERGASRHGPDRGCQIGVPTEHVKKLAKRIARDKFAELWGDAPGMLHTRGLFGGPSSGLGEKLIRLTISRTELKSVTGLITGHWYTGKHLVHLGLREEASCLRCGEEAETPQHLSVR
ncbi:uncharacterized protein LOC125500980 [Athalia rosae]|uniref:uncharacterized protein LOC125500980 n=1 Tax=Athalia rosae TaxID=37344 RepID=UPI002033C1A2|nr:uncharacterized protein LOC125500980 [Athalia rosae]